MTKMFHSFTLAATLMASTAIADPIIQSFTFKSAGSMLEGTLYLPEEHSGDALPTVLVTGAWTTVQEQMPSLYAAEMTERGFAAVTFDFRGWGRSEDLPGGQRFREDPAAKIEDIRAAIAHIATLPQVDATRIHGMGICASAGYMLDAARGNDLIASVGLVAPWLQNAEIVETVYGGADGVEALIQVSRTAAAAGGELIPAAGPAGAEGVLMPLDGYYVDPARGAIPEYDNQWNQTSWEGWLTYHPIDNAASFDKPLSIVHSEAAAIPQGVKAFVADLTDDATLHWLENVTQFDFYDNPEDVTRAADKLAEHFNLSAQEAYLHAVDRAQITALVSSVPLAVDLAAYDLAQAAFADPVTVDYTSLWGGDAATMSPEALMAAWRGIVPGFDATWHELGEVQVEIEGDSAQAIATVDGRHYLKGQVWRPIGLYRWELDKRADGWKITKMVFEMTGEQGDRSLAAQAMERAALAQ